MTTLAHKKHFTENLLQWNRMDNVRAMPWKGEKDPYRIWLSEIILQQTRVEQGLQYYNRFIETFPTIKDLACAPENKVFKLWEGLGYYTRCKNLIATAKYVHEELNGIFPDKYEDILALKGIGPYTAAAIGSFAFNLPHAVVDGNVFRVLARFFGISVATDTTQGRQLFSKLAQELLDKEKPGIYNQAVMDFGAVICKPQLPLCEVCILQRACNAYRLGRVQQLPVKEKLVSKRTRWFYYLVIDYRGAVYVRKRAAGDIWENLYEFVLVEAPAALSLETLQPVREILGENFELEHISPLYKQLLTHQTIRGCFIRLKVKAPVSIDGYHLVGKTAFQQLPLPKFISAYLGDKNVSLNLF